jgi:hypothetical protein
MNNLSEQVPGICREVGLTCKRCTEDSAASLAVTCKGLRTKAVVQLFHQIYPHSACASMSSHFAKSYRAASQMPLLLLEFEISAPSLRKEVTSIRPRRMAAVA